MEFHKVRFTAMEFHYLVEVLVIMTDTTSQDDGEESDLK